MSTDDAGTLIGSDVIIEDSIVAAGASVTDGAKVDCSFVGESVHIGKGFSSEASLFFANSYMDNGESCAAFCGPFATSHHKSTFLIGGAFSFYNAGSGTNQSNHAYKMGPIHWGTLDRGSKTASGSHILWPAHIGSFSMVMGKVQNHPQVQKLPFSYVIAEGRETCLVPGINIRTVGTWRDVNKWPNVTNVLSVRATTSSTSPSQIPTSSSPCWRESHPRRPPEEAPRGHGGVHLSWLQNQAGGFAEGHPVL